ncbi:right-handed parallel beta-helix repeat-containing protein [Akkermansiaceae bacterium]|nr:right-handed parallel beta-helix repeat-containing protein [Akkermansiaceae bacterium]
MNNNKRKDVNRDPDLIIVGAKPKRPFRGVILSGLILGALFIAYYFWSAEQTRKIEEQQRIEQEAKLRAAIIAENAAKAQDALAENRLDDAEALMVSSLELDKSNVAANDLLLEVRKKKLDREIANEQSNFTLSLDKKDVKGTEGSLEKLKALDPENPDLNNFSNQLVALKGQVAEDKKEARNIFLEALALDKGVYSGEAITLLKKAEILDPESKDVSQLLKKMSDYTTIIKVPSDFATIGEALDAARPRDLIEVGAGVYKESLIITKPVYIKGLGEGKSIIEGSDEGSSIIYIGAEATGTTISGFSMKHTVFDYSDERLSGITCQAKIVEINACIIEQSMGHGIAVIDGADISISSCKITGSGWDGISVYGQGSKAYIKDTRCDGNMQHGIQLWNGGSGTVIKSFTMKNNFCGILVDSPDSNIKIESSGCSNNREAGILVSSGTVEMNSNSCHENINSGIVARGDKSSISMTANSTTKNQEAGIMIHQVVTVTKFDANVSEKNVTHQIAKAK